MVNNTALAGDLSAVKTAHKANSFVTFHRGLTLFVVALQPLWSRLVQRNTE